LRHLNPHLLGAPNTQQPSEVIASERWGICSECAGRVYCTLATVAALGFFGLLVYWGCCAHECVPSRRVSKTEDNVV
jgi:hypothetical protein